MQMSIQVTDSSTDRKDSDRTENAFPTREGGFPSTAACMDVCFSIGADPGVCQQEALGQRGVILEPLYLECTNQHTTVHDGSEYAHG